MNPFNVGLERRAQVDPSHPSAVCVHQGEEDNVVALAWDRVGGVVWCLLGYGKTCSCAAKPCHPFCTPSSNPAINSK